MKRCSCCGEMLPLEDFHRHVDGQSGVRRKCKRCISEYGKLYQEDLRRRNDAERVKVELYPAEVKASVACDYCIWLEVCRDRVRRGMYVACEHPTDDDYLRAALVEARVR